MRKFWTLAAAVFVLALAATGSGWAAPAGDEAVEHRVWLPVVWTPAILPGNTYFACPYRLTLIAPEDGALTSGPTEFRVEADRIGRFNEGPEPAAMIFGFYQNCNIEHLESDDVYDAWDAWKVFIESSISFDVDALDSGEHCWRTRLLCQPKIGNYGPWTEMQTFIVND